MALLVFPVAPEAKPTFVDDWHAPRSGGRLHQGTDIFAPLGSPVLAIDDGRVERSTEPRGGIVATLHATDGTRYVYAHLNAYPEGPGLARAQVRAGDVIGFVGDTGNAKGTPPHLHFEVHPDNARGPGSAVPPVPILRDIAPPGAFRGAPGRKDGGNGLAVLVVLYLLSRRT